MAFGDFTVVRSTPKRVTNSSGVLAEVAINTPAFEFNTDGTYKGLLVEPAATNLVLRSQEFDNASWEKTNSGSGVLPVVTANAGVAPDGTSTADNIVFNSGAGVLNTDISRVQQFVTTTNVSHAYSFFIRSNTGANQTLVARFNSLIGASQTIIATNEWQRLNVIGTASAGSRAFGLETRGDVSVGADILIWGAQLETGSVATSYIPTVASTANRTADSISLTGASSLIGQTSGTIFVEVDWKFVTGVQQNLISTSDGSAGNSFIRIVKLANNQLSMSAVANNVSQTEQGQASGGYSGIQKIALAYALNDAALYRNGSSISTDVTFDMSAGSARGQINLGANRAGGIQANMWIRSVALFPTRLSNAQLESLTTL